MNLYTQHIDKILEMKEEHSRNAVSTHLGLHYDKMNRILAHHKKVTGEEIEFKNDSRGNNSSFIHFEVGNDLLKRKWIN